MRFQYTTHWDDEGRWRPVMTTIDIEGARTDGGATSGITTVMELQRTFWEVELLEAIAMRGPRGGVYIDAGANIGNHSVYFGKFLAQYVVAIEPQEVLVPILRRNLEANGIRQYTVLACALGAEVGVGRMIPGPAGFEKDLATNQLEALEGRDATVANSGMVPITTLDRALDEVASKVGDGRVTFVKLDVEGMEVDALKGAMNLLKNHRPQLAVEANTREAHLAVRAFLAQLGYREVGDFCDTPTLVFALEDVEAKLGRMCYFIDPQVHQLRSSWWSLAHLEERRLQLALTELAAVIPPGDAFILVDEDRWGSSEVLAGRQRIPFLERDGQYWGTPPDDATARQEFERLRRGGARFMVFGWPAFWWLEYYAGLHQHLRAAFPCVLENDRLVVFDLRP